MTACKIIKRRWKHNRWRDHISSQFQLNISVFMSKWIKFINCYTIKSCRQGDHYDCKPNVLHSVWLIVKKLTKGVSIYTSQKRYNRNIHPIIFTCTLTLNKIFRNLFIVIWFFSFYLYYLTNFEGGKNHWVGVNFLDKRI